MKKLVRESLDNYNDTYEPWTNNPKENEIMGKLLDKFEDTVGTLEETDYDTVWQIKMALWIGYKYNSE